MNLRMLLALVTGAGLLAVAPATIADDDDGKRTAPAMQVRMDKNTGKKMAQDDDAGKAPVMAATGVTDTGRNANVSVMMPASGAAVQYHADGSMSAKVGLEQMKYLVVSKGDDGTLVLSHRPAGDAESATPASPIERGEE